MNIDDFTIEKQNDVSEDNVNADKKLQNENETENYYTELEEKYWKYINEKNDSKFILISIISSLSLRTKRYLLFSRFRNTKSIEQK